MTPAERTAFVTEARRCLQRADEKEPGKLSRDLYAAALVNAVLALQPVEVEEFRTLTPAEASPADAWAPMTNAAEAARLRRTLPVMDEPFEPDSQQVFIDGSGLLWVFPSEGRSLVLDPATKRFDDSRAFRPPKVGRFGHVLGLRYVPPTGAGS